jgi:hypothetical protein
VNEPSNIKAALVFVRDSMPSAMTKTHATAEAWGNKGHSWKPLPTQFRRDGFKYRQIAREGGCAIYEQRWSGCRNPSVCYEVIRIRRREGFQIGARFIEPAEIYPNSEAWGVDGFTFTDKDVAFAKLRELAAQTNSRPWHYLRGRNRNNKSKIKPLF